MSMVRRICVCCLTEGVPKRAFVVALIVGTALNLINQGDAILGEGRVNAAKLVLTFLVPYVVSTYGAVSYRLGVERHAKG